MMSHSDSVAEISVGLTGCRRCGKWLDGHFR
jgi:hypothetical protein